MYSSIFALSFDKESDSERSSTTKSGQICANFPRCFLVKVFHLASFIQLKSGERTAPLGSVKPDEESKPFPVPSFSTQTANFPVKLKFFPPVSLKVGGIITVFPSLSLSILKSLCRWQKWKNSSSLIGLSNEPKSTSIVSYG